MTWGTAPWAGGRGRGWGKGRYGEPQRRARAAGPMISRPSRWERLYDAAGLAASSWALVYHRRLAARINLPARDLMGPRACLMPARPRSPAAGRRSPAG